MSGADGGDFAGVARGCEPIVDRGADGAAADRRLARALVAGDQEDKAIAARNRLLERTIDRTPCAVEAHSVEVDDAVGLHASAPQATVPAAVERGPGAGRSRGDG